MRMQSRRRAAGTKRGFVQWLQFCATKRAEEERFKQMSKRARSALLKMLKNATLGALIRWKAVVATRNAILASAKKLCRFAVEAYEDNVKFATRRALRTWHTALQRLDKRSMLSGHKLALVIKSLQSKSHARLAAAWRRLERQVSSEREASRHRKRRGEVVTRVATAMGKRGQRRALNAWKQLAADFKLALAVTRTLKNVTSSAPSLHLHGLPWLAAGCDGRDAPPARGRLGGAHGGAARAARRVRARPAALPPRLARPRSSW